MSQQNRTQDAAPRSTPPHSAHLRVTLLGIACVAFGLLIWSRLLLVTNYPKTAIATPPVAQPLAGPQSQGRGTAVSNAD